MVSWRSWRPENQMVFMVSIRAVGNLWVLENLEVLYWLCKTHRSSIGSRRHGSLLWSLEDMEVFYVLQKTCKTSRWSWESSMVSRRSWRSSTGSRRPGSRLRSLEDLEFPFGLWKISTLLWSQEEENGIIWIKRRCGGILLSGRHGISLWAVKDLHSLWSQEEVFYGLKGMWTHTIVYRRFEIFYFLRRFGSIPFFPFSI